MSFLTVMIIHSNDDYDHADEPAGVGTPFFKQGMSGEGRMAYNKAPTKEKLRKWGRLSSKGDKIKFVDVRFKR